MDELYKEIANALGATYVEMPDATECCGAGSEGSTAMDIATKKVQNADLVDATLCPLSCAGCEAMLGVASRQAKTKAKFTSISALVASCFDDLDEIIEKLNK